MQGTPMQVSPVNSSNEVASPATNSSNGTTSSPATNSSNEVASPVINSSNGTTSSPATNSSNEVASSSIDNFQPGQCTTSPLLSFQPGQCTTPPLLSAHTLDQSQNPKSTQNQNQNRNQNQYGQVRGREALSILPLLSASETVREHQLHAAHGARFSPWILPC
jgi:hypothetical protein